MDKYHRLIVVVQCALPEEGNKKNPPSLAHSPGEVACTNDETYTGSLALHGILSARVGGGCIAIVRGEELNGTYFSGSKQGK